MKIKWVNEQGFRAVSGTQWCYLLLLLLLLLLEHSSSNGKGETITFYDCELEISS